MLEDRNLKIAILISASWHFAFMIFVSPVIVSGNIRKNATAISFLGSILERVAVVPERPLNLDRSYFMQHIENTAADTVNKPDLVQPKMIPKSVDTEPDKEEFVFYENKKEPSASDLHSEKKYKHIIEFSDVMVGGDAKNRMILFNPDLPRVVIFYSDFDFNYRVTVRFKISEHGFVKAPECVISSGLPEVDQVALRYIRKWQFMPDTESPGRLIEGFASINLANGAD